MDGVKVEGPLERLEHGVVSLTSVTSSLHTAIVVATPAPRKYELAPPELRLPDVAKLLERDLADERFEDLVGVALEAGGEEDVVTRAPSSCRGEATPRQWLHGSFRARSPTLPPRQGHAFWRGWNVPVWPTD